MALLNSSNPVLSEKRFRDTILDDVVTHENAMTVKGTLQKFGFLLLMVLATSFYSWREFFAQSGSVMPLILIGGIGGFVIAMVISFKKEWSAYLTPAYALLEGLFIGAISAYYSAAFAAKAPNIVINAVGLTLGTAIAMYLLYSFRIIQATQKFKAIMFTAIAGIFIFYLITFVLGFFGIQIPFLHEGSVLGIGFSLFVVAIAALTFILNFDMIEKGAELGAPKYMEWYGAFGLLVTIVWLYLEILRLLSKLNSRN